MADDARAFRRDWRTLETRDGRNVAVQILTPEPDRAIRSAIIFSHGANASPQLYDALLLAWARRGFVVLAPLHVDSEAHPERDAYDREAIRKTRIEDYGLIDAWLAKGAHSEAGTIAAGHSYGALVAQVAGGALLADGYPRKRYWRLPAAVVALSPPPPMPGVIDAAGWQCVSVPQLCVTGTSDEMPGFVPHWRLHLASHEAVAVERRYALVFAGMDHYFNGAFGRLRAHAEDPAIAALNAAVCAFAEAALSGAPPSPEAWRALGIMGAAALAG